MNETRITIDPNQMDGVLCIRRLRIPVATITALLDEGVNDAEILRLYPDLEAADIEVVRNAKD